MAGTITTVTSSHEAEGWYVCCSCAEVPTAPLPLTGHETGSDVGLRVFRITADEQSGDTPRHYRRAERARTQAQPRVSRRQQGSKRRRQAVQVLATQQQPVQRQRADFHHKTARALVRAYDGLSVAALHPANLSRRPTPK